ncbi:outer membrane beta-barrel family protein [Robertkochia sediminum]|uniref:outer membrane beta-barrel family protein n=1 Tax=Robertkochia sediminum TaxID=2785326 RepID=UPI001933EA27|nr:outer membrane beta-barrel family protein [Robertkochia sediminum]MBL7471452.1 outer membrane beta-barrel protein [Robertkochia sediminum]
MHRPFVKIFGIFFLCSFLSTAQDYDLSGKITDSEDLPLSFVNILLLNAQDSTLVNGVISGDDGRFLFQDVTAGNYVIQSSYIGYQTHFLPVEVNGNTATETIKLMPATETLQGVTVSYRKPTIEKRPDRLVFNVANTTLSSLSGYEILKRTPGVIVMNEQLMVKNSEPVVYLNDKRVYLSNAELNSLLQGFAGVNVEAVEVITNPPASYDAEGSVVLNIVTRSNVSIGYKGSLETRGTFAVYPKYNFNTQHYYKTKGLDFFFNYNFNRSKLFKNDLSFINFTDVGEGTEAWNTNFKKITRLNDHSVNAILDIDTGESSTLSLSANVLWSPDKTFDNSAVTNIAGPDNTLASYFNTDSDMEYDTYNYVFGAEFDTELDDEGTTLESVANYIYYEQDQLQALTTAYFDPFGVPEDLNAFDTEGQQQTNIFTLQTDLSGTWAGGDVKTGLKFVNINSSSGIGFSGPSIPDNALDDDFDYNEAIYAFYAEYGRSWEKWELQLGSRMEYTDVTANSIALGDVNTQKYFGIFPSLGVQYVPSEANSYGMSYGRSLTRPRYQSLNPFRYYIIEDRYNEGNPELTRAIEDKLALSYTYNNTYTFEIGFQNIDGDINSLPFQDNGNRQLYRREENIQQFRQYNLDFMAPLNIMRNWYAYVVASGYYMENQFIARESGNILVKNNTNGFLTFLSSGTTLGKKEDTNLDVSYVFISDMISGSEKYQNMHYLDISVRKNLWNDRASLTMGLNDVFNTTNVQMNSRYLNQDNGFLARPETRKFFLAFRYNFGNFRLNDNNRSRNNPAELERLNAGS